LSTIHESGSDARQRRNKRLSRKETNQFPKYKSPHIKKYAGCAVFKLFDAD